jgi:hypothetical protein
VSRRGHRSWYFSIDLHAPATAAVRSGAFAGAGSHHGGAAAEALSRLRTPDSGAVAARVVTVSAWLEHWLATRTSQQASTLRGYRSHVRVYLTSHLGRIPLAELTVGQVRGRCRPSSPRSAVTSAPAPL